ncbi:MAG: hypothetical protein NWR87_03200 [Rhodospirillales bacterium]|nr:hypothetical protein [Rhodospirillales bacterium]
MAQRNITSFLVSESKPDGYRLEDIVREIRNDILVRCTHVMEDGRPEVGLVMANNMEILGMLSDVIALAENSTELLSRIYGTDQAGMHEPPSAK